MKKKDLGIVICNFNKLEYLKGCLETLYKSNVEKLTYDVIVVDNASTDGSPDFLKHNYPQIILLENKDNLGGSGGFDRGMRYSIQQEYSYVVLLDNDILLEENTILNLYKYIKAHPEVGVVGSKICTMDNPDVLQEMGSFIDFDNKFNVETPLKSYKDDDSLPDVVVCDYVPACCLITSREVLKKVGTFNTEHFIYWDDMDWCTRVKRQGYEIHAINDSRVFHKMGVSNHKNTFGLYYFERNRMLFFLRYLQDDRLKDFSNSIVKWVVPLLFFSNLKGNYAAPKSFLCAIDDLVGGRLGKQENSIFEKCNEKNVFHKYSLDRNDNVVIFMNGDMISNRRVYFYLKEFYNQISICVDKVNYNAVKNNFHEEILLKKELVSTYFRNVFFVCEHILEFQKNEMFDENFIFMDGFLNFASLNDIKLLSMQYEMYKELFVNIHQPMLERSFKLIRNNLLVKERNEDISGA